MSDSGREWLSEKSISREALMKTVENLTVSNQKLLTENDKLRGLLAAGKGDCAYCGLPAAEIAKCPHGFPGCARMDDIVNAPESEFERGWAASVYRCGKLENCIRELLKGGEHEGECTNEFMGRIGPCVHHIYKSDERESAARKLLEDTDGQHPTPTV